MIKVLRSELLFIVSVFLTVVGSSFCSFSLLLFLYLLDLEWRALGEERRRCGEDESYIQERGREEREASGNGEEGEKREGGRDRV